jgi:hypothetical protein
MTENARNAPSPAPVKKRQAELMMTFDMFDGPNGCRTTPAAAHGFRG